MMPNTSSLHTRFRKGLHHLKQFSLKKKKSNIKQVFSLFSSQSSLFFDDRCAAQGKKKKKRTQFPEECQTNSSVLKNK